MPSKFFKDKFLIEKIIAGSVVDYMYRKHSILTYFAINEDIIFKISPPVIIKEKELMIFFKALDLTLDKGINNLILQFIKRKFFA